MEKDMKSIEFSKDLKFIVGESSSYLKGNVVKFITEYQYGVCVGFHNGNYEDCIYFNWDGKEVFAHQV
jgi:hypothetical protein